MAAVQQAIKDASKPTDDPNHDSTDVHAWLTEVARLVETSLPPASEEKYDENMRAGAVMSVVLALHYGRLHFAKIHDPARPVAIRQRAYERWLAWSQALLSVLLDEREDATYFPGQKWDYPFGHAAVDGEFV